MKPRKQEVTSRVSKTLRNAIEKNEKKTEKSVWGGRSI